MGEQLIPLSRGLYAVVDSADFDEISKHRWSILASGSGPFYAARKITVGLNKRKVLLMHRVIMRAADGDKVDHKNGNSLDNRRSNLRIATDTENQRGFLSPRTNKTSRFRGVHFRKKSGRWIAQISINRKIVHLGCFTSEEDAARAYNESAAKHFGKFAQLNNVLSRGGRGTVSPLDRL